MAFLPIFIEYMLEKKTLIIVFPPFCCAIEQ